ncbi:heat shock factor protein 5-like [Saimiri boliviensis]|uniref:heat shock factor protein 5-like n=1 Tax=Saimiri boliviensis TaxID=27679 RepID=UPI003D78036C
MQEAPLSIPIKPNNFPAERWRLVNSPWWCRVGRGRVGVGAGGEAGRRDRPLHHFRNRHFRRGQPQLLVHRERRTGSKEAKLAAGLEVPCRPPSGFQWLPAAAHHLGLRLRPLGRRPDPAAAPGAATCAADSRPEPHGPGAVGQFHRSLRRGGFPPYSYVTSSHDRSTFPMKSLDRTPVARRIWQNSLGTHPGQVETSPTFSEKRCCQFFSWILAFRGFLDLLFINTSRSELGSLFYIDEPDLPLNTDSR